MRWAIRVIEIELSCPVSARLRAMGNRNVHFGQCGQCGIHVSDAEAEVTGTVDTRLCGKRFVTRQLRRTRDVQGVNLIPILIVPMAGKVEGAGDAPPASSPGH